MSYFVYVIKSQLSDKIYIGQTNNLKLRLQRHNCEIKSRKNCYTHKNKGPWVVIYKEEYLTRTESIKREAELKSFKGREFIKNMGL